MTAVSGDGSHVDVYLCLRGLLERLELAEADAGLVVIMTYGLMKGSDLEVLPTTWRAQVAAALRMAVLHGLKPEGKSKQSAEKLQALVELWRPTWRQDYECFCQRGRVSSLLRAALAAAHQLRRAPEYTDASSARECEEQALARVDLAMLEAGPPSLAAVDSDQDVASI